MRPHVLLVGDDEALQPLRLYLQANWLLSIASDLSQAIFLAAALQPSRCVVDQSFADATLLLERLKRTHETRHQPILFLARTERQAVEALDCGVAGVQVVDVPITDRELGAIHSALESCSPACNWCTVPCR